MKYTHPLKLQFRIMNDLKLENKQLKKVIYTKNIEILLLKLQISILPHIKTHKSIIVYTPEAKKLLVSFILEHTFLPIVKILKHLNLSSTTFYNWFKYSPKTSRGPSVLKITPYEKQLLIETKIENMNYGHKKIAGLARNKQLWLSSSSSYNILKDNNLLLPPSSYIKPLKSPKYEPYRKLMVIESDWTKFRIDNRLWSILCAIDVYSRYILDWSLIKNVTSNDIELLVKNIYKNNSFYFQYFSPKLRLDQHPSNISLNIKSLCKQLGYSLSPGRVQRPTDQSRIERFFKTLKDECLKHNKHIDLNETRTLISNYITYYNKRRPHEVLFNFTPFEVHHQYRNKSEIYLIYKNKLKESLKLRIKFNESV